MSKTICERLGRHFWAWPWQRTQRCLACGALKNLHVGEQSITLSPSGVGDVIRWSASQAPVVSGDIGMNIIDANNGRPQIRAYSASRDMGFYDESFAQVGDGVRASGGPTQWFDFTVAPDNIDTCYVLSAYFIVDNVGLNQRLSLRFNGSAAVNGDWYVETKARFQVGTGAATTLSASASRSHLCTFDSAHASDDRYAFLRAYVFSYANSIRPIMYSCQGSLWENADATDYFSALNSAGKRNALTALTSIGIGAYGGAILQDDSWVVLQRFPMAVFS